MKTSWLAGAGDAGALPDSAARNMLVKDPPASAGVGALNGGGADGVAGADASGLLDSAARYRLVNTPGSLGFSTLEAISAAENILVNSPIGASSAGLAWLSAGESGFVIAAISCFILSTSPGWKNLVNSPGPCPSRQVSGHPRRNRRGGRWLHRRGLGCRGRGVTGVGAGVGGVAAPPGLAKSIVNSPGASVSAGGICEAGKPDRWRGNAQYGLSHHWHLSGGNVGLRSSRSVRAIARAWMSPRKQSSRLPRNE